MDTSKEYIKQCEKAVKIQEEWIPMRGDRVVIVRENKSADVIRFLHQEEADSICGWKMGSIKIEKEMKSIFCPRQDQLQGMVEKPDSCHLIEDFYKWWDTPKETKELHSSMEQLWLAFVMKEKFNKVWNGEEWN